MEDTATTIGWLLARISVAYVFLYAAWMNTRDAASREWTVGQTALTLGFVPQEWRRKAAVLGAIAGMAMMYGGGISVLIGLEGRLGALALLVFSALGMGTHRVNREQALALAKEIGTAAPAVNDKAQTLGWSAYGAHLAAGLKNISLIGINALFLLHKSGFGPWAKPWAVSDLIGRWFF